MFALVLGEVLAGLLGAGGGAVGELVLEEGVDSETEYDSVDGVNLEVCAFDGAPPCS
jgi:hypothetical protein